MKITFLMMFVISVSGSGGQLLALFLSVSFVFALGVFMIIPLSMIITAYYVDPEKGGY